MSRSSSQARHSVLELACEIEGSSSKDMQTSAFKHGNSHSSIA